MVEIHSVMLPSTRCLVTHLVRLVPCIPQMLFDFGFDTFAIDIHNLQTFRIDKLDVLCKLRNEEFLDEFPLATIRIRKLFVV